ncbi:cobalt ABC transporter, inner membrane subunit CbiQ [Methanococcus maripaludis C5]|uniref:Cobalt ABC transporter, inner membrane subunit CbiQ n=1 Tax=Methanococcus maripaludis (strain C5 / ATCC BAA-1333) TaxID=402880 RepID=A4FW41_METM5|nr:cobalt ECF transporter T component CbiQ [Methanococcus maripaludis]ABO34412.1 cobalt ABC transporter, inner membrane subunit CbiQ [Methanococcus maripaludis C5]
MTNSYLIDSIANCNSLRSVNPTLKVIFAVSSLLVSLFSKTFVVPFLIAFIMSFVVIFAAKVPKTVYLKLLSIPFIFGIITFVMMTFLFGTEIYMSFDFFGITLNLLKDGFSLGLLTFFKMLGGVSCTLFLALTTPFTELFCILKKSKMPKNMLEIAMMMYRYIFMLMDETLSIENSQKTRLGYKNLKTSYHSLGLLAGSLFIKALDKGDVIYNSLNSRGYDGNLMFFGDISYPKTNSVVLIGIFELLLLSLNYIKIY